MCAYSVSRFGKAAGLVYVQICLFPETGESFASLVHYSRNTAI